MNLPVGLKKYWKIHAVLLSFACLLLVTISSVGQPTDPPYSETDCGQVRKPVAPVRITGNMKLPLNTHSWNVNLYYNGDDWSNGAFPGMISLVADPMCIHVNNHGNGAPVITNMELKYVYHEGGGNPHFRVPHELSEALIVFPKSGKVGEPKLDAYSDWGIKMQWDNGALEAYVANGSPFVYFHANDGGITINTLDKAKVWYNEANVIGVAVEINVQDETGQWHYYGDNNYVLYAPTGATWQATKDTDGNTSFTSTLAGKKYASIATIPNDKEESKRIANLNFFKKYAFNFMVDTKVAWKYDEKKSLVTTTFTGTIDKKEGNTDGLVYALYPHQWQNYKGATTDIVLNCAKGPMKVIETKGNFKTEMKYHGVLPHFPLVANEQSGFTKDKQIEYVKAIVESGEGNEIFQGNEVYATAVTVGRTAQVIPLADQIGLSEERDTISRWVKSALENWLSYSGDGDNAWFVYDKNYGVLIGNPPNRGMFTDLHLNDAHFQFGYFIKAAAIIAQFDKKWMADWGERVEMMIKNVANWKRGEPDYPFLRFLDPYQGHSWATGDADFLDGNNQESSSEALNCYSGIVLWGLITGNKTIRDLGIYLFTTECEGVLNYWWDIHHVCYPKGPDVGNQQGCIFEPAQYQIPMAGWVWGDKIGFGTWFGSSPVNCQEYPVGINILPLTASSLYLARDVEYVKKDLIDWFLGKFGGVRMWNEIFWNYLAMADAPRALEFYKTQPHGDDQPRPASETEAHYYHWIHSMCAMGAYNSKITADIPAFAAFDKNGVRTYVAYNPSDAEIKPTFSDRTSFPVPAGKVIAYTKPIAINSTVKPHNKVNFNATVQSINNTLYLVSHFSDNCKVSLFSLNGKKFGDLHIVKGKQKTALPFKSTASTIALLRITTNDNRHICKRVLLP